MLAFSTITAIHSDVDASSYSSAGNVAVVAGRLYVVFVNLAHGTLEPPYASGVAVGSLSFTEIGAAQGGLYSGSAPSVRRLQAWYAIASASDSANPLAVTLSGNTPSTSGDISMIEVTGFAASPIADNAFQASGASVLLLSVALGAFADSNNRALAMVSHRAAEASTPDTGFTSLDDGNHGAPSTGAITIRGNSGTDTTPGASWATSGQAGVFALEIAAAGGPEWYPHEGVQPWSSIWRPGRV